VSTYRFDPETYREVVEEIPDYRRLQSEVARSTSSVEVERMLELGTGTGETARQVLALHPGAQLVGIDESRDMLAEAGLPDAQLLVQRVEAALPPGPFDLVFSALTVHHLDGPGKADLFLRVHDVLRPGGRFVLGDVVLPERAADAVTPTTPDFDRPDSVADQLRWLEQAGFGARSAWQSRDLAVLVADRPARMAVP
jgi:tRNA (cmo5U34)-methyltransferase